MKITEVNCLRVAPVMVRGYFHVFFSGLASVLCPGKKGSEPKEYRQLLVDSFDDSSGYFVSVLSPVLIHLNYSDLDTVAEDMRQRHFSEATPAKILLRYACRSKELYDLATAKHQKQMFALLGERSQSAEDYFADCPTLTYENNVPVSLAIRSVIHVQIQTYTAGVTRAETEANGLHQATVYRLMTAGMTTLLHERPVKPGEESSEVMFRKVSLNSDSFERLMSEMDQAYEDLVQYKYFRNKDFKEVALKHYIICHHRAAIQPHFYGFQSQSLFYVLFYKACQETI